MTTLNNLKTLVIVKSIAAAAFVAAGVATPALSHASPNDGVQCRPGYSGQLNGGKFKCAKSEVREVTLRCTNTRFPTKVIRATIAGDAGRDLCVRPGIVIGSNDPLTGLTRGQDFVEAEFVPISVLAVREARERSEEQSLNLPREEVDADVTIQPSVVINGGLGAEDIARFTVTLTTFPVPATGFNLQQPIVVPNLPVSLGPLRP